MPALILMFFFLFHPLMADETVSVFPERIISMAPSVTEILFSLGLGHRVAGVTSYCDFPPQAAKITRVGGLVDPSYETIISLKPDLVILLTSHREVRKELEKMGLKTLMTPHEKISDIHEAFILIGKACNAEQRAKACVEILSQRADAVKQAVRGKNQVKTLICFGRDTASGQLSSVYSAGKNGFYDQIIELAGGVNAYCDEKIAFPQLSAEGVIELDPDVIVDLVLSAETGKSEAEICRQWDKLHTVKAVKNRNVHVISGSHSLRPGPRYILFLEQLAEILHPEAFPGAQH